MPYFFNEACCWKPFYNRVDDYFATIGNYFFGAHNLFYGVIAAFYQYIGLQQVDELEGGVLFKDHHNIYNKQRGKYKWSWMLIVDWAVWAF